MNKPIAIASVTRLRDASLFDDANDVSDSQGALARVEPASAAPSEDCSGLVPCDTDDPSDERAAGALHAAKSDDRCLLPKVRTPYVKPEIVSRELTLKRFNPCDL